MTIRTPILPAILPSSPPSGAEIKALYEAETDTNAFTDAEKAQLVDGILSRTTTITAAQLADLHNTPITLVPAPGVGKTMLLHHIAWYGSDNALEGSGEGQIGFILGLNDILSTTQVAAATAILRHVPSATSDWESYNEADDGVLEIYSDAAWTGIVGEIVSTALRDGGTGWAINDTFNIGTAEAIVDSVNAGVVLTYHITAGGNASGNSYATNPSGVGVDLQINVTELDYSVNPLTLKVKVIYSIFDISS